MKNNFTRAFLAGGGEDGPTTPGRRRQRIRGVWEKRFYEHSIRDFEDFRRHMDYIHTNPVKHRYVNRPADWPWSSFHRYVKAGWYEEEWCGPLDVFASEDLEPEGG
jgi:putative transposase